MFRNLKQTFNKTLMTVIAGTLGAAVVLFAVLQPTMDIRVGTDPNIYDGLMDQLIFLSVIALFIERAIETYLRATGLRSERVIDPATRTEYRYRPISPHALTTGVVLAGLVALGGVRLIGPVMGYENFVCKGLSDWAVACGRILVGSADIVLTTGLLAGGSSLLSHIMRLVPTLTGRVSTAVTGAPDAASRVTHKVYLRSLEDLARVGDAVALQSLTGGAVAQHTIRIDRGVGTTGVLYFQNTVTSFNVPCKWDGQNRIDAGTFPRCSKTTIDTKLRPAIHMLGAVLDGSPNNKIFIHRDEDETWSDGCIVLARADMQKLLDAIPKSDAFNITVTVRDI